jgi:predicted regulator of Ras-like GTPase activity (Roadblock/LC7/MglB family)
MTSDLRTTAGGFHWLLADFVRNTDGVRDAVAVSSDGLLVAKSDGLDRTAADHLAAIISGLGSLGRSAARRYDFDGLKMIMIEMHRGFLVVSAFSGGGCVGVLAGADADPGLIGYEITVLVDRVGEALTPSLIAESRKALEP